MELSEGNWVVVSSPDNFSGKKVAVYMGKCKKCHGHKVRLHDPEASVPELCIVEDHGDTILKASK